MNLNIYHRHTFNLDFLLQRECYTESIKYFTCYKLTAAENNPIELIQNAPNFVAPIMYYA